MKHYTKDQKLVLLGAALYQLALVGVLANCAGVILAQLRLDMNFPMSHMANYQTARGIANVLGATVMVRLFMKGRKLPFLLLSMAGVIAAHAMLTVPVVTWQWYASAVLYGWLFCLSTVMVPDILNDWFPDSAATVTGFAMAFSGLGGVLFNPVAQFLIERTGLRGAVYTLSGVMLVLTVPSVWLLCRRTAPGAAERRQKKAAAAAVTARGEKPLKTMLLCFLMLQAGSVCQCFIQYISVYTELQGQTLAFGALLTSIAMVGNVSGKLIYGWACDRFGVWPSTVGALLLLVTSQLLFLLGGGTQLTLAVGALTFGAVYTAVAVFPTRICYAAYGNEQARRFMSGHISVNGLVYIGMAFVMGPLFQWRDSFAPFFVISICSCLLALAAALYLAAQKKGE